MCGGGLPEDVLARGAELNARLRAAQDAFDKESSKPKEMQSQEQRSAAYNDLSRAQAALDTYEKDLLEKYPAYASLMHPSPRPLADIRKTVIADDEAALEFLLGNDVSYLLFIAKDGMWIVSLPARKKIDTKIKNFRSLLTRPDSDPAETLKYGEELYDILLGPVADHLKNYKSLLIIPTESLYFLPFETLAVNSGADGAHYLVNDYDIRYAPSLNVLYMAARASADTMINKGNSWLGFGDPVYQSECDSRAADRSINEDTALMVSSYTRAMADENGNRGGVWCRLPGTAEEVSAIAGLFDSAGASSTVELGFNATEANFKKLASRGERFLHIASHGTLGEGGARQPALVLSLSGEAAGDDGFLTMSEVFNLKVPADMVVLSACKTGQGLMEKGEGVAGMSRAFLYSGAKSMVVSLWSVADKETVELMKDFYGRMLKSNTPRSAALLQARRDMASKGLAPFFWAPFIYVGLR